MFKYLFLILLFGSSLVYGNYQIKIGVYANKAKLKQNLSRIKPSYRKQIVKTRKRNKTYLNSVVYVSKKRAKKALRVYKRVFRDAFIAKTRAKRTSKLSRAEKAKKIKKEKLEKRLKKEAKAKIKAKRQKQKALKKDLSKKDAVKKKPLIEPKESVEWRKPIKIIVPPVTFDAKALLENKTVYLCYDKRKTFMKKRLMQMEFTPEVMLYKTLLNEEKPLKVPYHFDGENVVLKLSGFEFTHKIIDNNITFLHLKSFKEGVEGTTLRYYFDKKAALEYVQTP